MSASDFFDNLGATLKGMTKLVLQSRPTSIEMTQGDRPLIIMGNGPSLRPVIEQTPQILTGNDTLAVNFAANDPSFRLIKPRYYVAVDPHFFTGAATDSNVPRLMANFETVDWKMTLFVPTGRLTRDFRINNPNVTVTRINNIGIEGFSLFTRLIYGNRLGMPRPRNVLIASLMAAIWLGYKQIYLIGADHSWSRTLSVTDDNVVVSVQPHFYKDNGSEARRSASVYGNVRLHEVMYSYYVAFKAYHEIAAYARPLGIKIYNSTPGSFIDAFERRPLPGPTS